VKIGSIRDLVKQYLLCFVMFSPNELRHLRFPEQKALISWTCPVQAKEEVDRLQQLMKDRSDLAFGSALVCTVADWLAHAALRTFFAFVVVHGVWHGFPVEALYVTIKRRVAHVHEGQALR
jgi:hypothetical protein